MDALEALIAAGIVKVIPVGYEREGEAAGQLIEREGGR